MSAIPSLPSRRVLLGLVIAFFGLTTAIYGHSVRYDFVRWDDGMLVYENPAIREISPESLTRIFTSYDPELYIPLTFLSYQIDYQIGGQNAAIYHTTNLIFHTLNALLVVWLLYLLSKKKWPAMNPNEATALANASGEVSGSWIAIAAGLLFLLHPLHTEAVEWVSARKDLLSTFFFLLSLIGYVYWQERSERRTLILSLLMFTLGLLSKVMIITLPIILVLIDFLEGRQWWRWQTLKEKIPYVALSVLFGIIGVLGKTGVIQSSTLSAKVLMATKSAVFYLQQIVWPVHFSLLYPYVKPITLTSPDFFVPILVLIAIAIVAWYSKKWGRVFIFGACFYLITVAPTFLNFAKGGELDVYFASDRYAYVPSIGVFFALLWLLDLGIRRIARSDSRVSDRIGAGIAALLIACCAVLAYRQSLVWRNTETLFQNVLRYYPESSHVAHNNLGNVYRLRNDYAAAIEEYNQAIAIRPHAKTISNLGAVYRKLKQYSKAHEQYAKALEIDPDSKEAHFGLGLVLLEEGKTTDAQAEFRKAIAIDPRYEEAYTNLGAALIQEGKSAEAMEEYRKAIAINSFFPDAHYNLAVALTDTGQRIDAIDEYAWVVRLAPAFIPARINYALLLYQDGRKDDAIAQFRAILAIDPENAAAKQALRQLGTGD